MRKGRKFLCLLLCAVLLLSMSAAALGANNKYSSWFQTNYDEINKLGLMPESFNGLDLTKNITRGEMWKTDNDTYALGGMAICNGYAVFGNDYNHLYIVK